MEQKHQIADPGSLGLAAFALTTFVLSLSNAQILPAAASAIILPLGLLYGGVAQVIAGIFEFKRNNAFGATAFTSYGFFWLCLCSLTLFEITGLINFGESKGIAMGTFLIAWTIFTIYMWIGTMKINAGLFTTFSLLLITFVLLVLTEFKIISGPIAGYFGILAAFSAWYVSAAGILNELFGRPVLPIRSFAEKSSPIKRAA